MSITLADYCLETQKSGVCEEISVNNQIFYDNELAEGLFKSFPPCFIYSSERIVCQEHRLFLACGSIKQIPIPGAAPRT